MNPLDHKVIEILSVPKKHPHTGKDWWTVKVKVDCWGRVSEETLTLTSEEELAKVKVGYVYQA